MLRSAFAALAVASITLLASPAAAGAATTTASCAGGVDPYAGADIVSSDDYNVAPGDTITVTWEAGYFAPGVPVEIVTSGPAAAGSQVESPGVAAADGSLSVSVTVAPDASGSISVAGWTTEACGGTTVQVSDPAGSSAAAITADSDSDALAFTGGSVSTVLLVSGAGAVAFGAILLVARSRVRRQSQD